MAALSLCTFDEKEYVFFEIFLLEIDVFIFLSY